MFQLHKIYCCKGTERKEDNKWEAESKKKNNKSADELSSFA